MPNRMPVPHDLASLRGEDIPASEITTESAYLNRRQLLKQMLALGLVGSSGIAQAAETRSIFEKLFGEEEVKTTRQLKPLEFTKNLKYNTSETLTEEKLATSYNNFYEFSYDKEEPSYIAGSLNVDPWQFQVSGHAEKTGTFNLEDILANNPLEERIYRMRCVEAWSMVIPWIGFPLANFIKQFQPTSKAKFVEFKTLYDPKQLPGQQASAFGSLDWPYTEGLTIEEAMNPLTLMVVGMYGKQIPNQNGAPIRLIVPWKYGFKGIKSIVSMRFSETRPKGSWEISAPREYGFYANVNPDVAHPRWSQALERRLTNSSLSGIKRIATQPFNGYAEHVAHLYKGLDLTRNY